MREAPTSGVWRWSVSAQNRIKGTVSSSGRFYSVILYEEGNTMKTVFFDRSRNDGIEWRRICRVGV